MPIMPRLPVSLPVSVGLCANTKGAAIPILLDPFENGSLPQANPISLRMSPWRSYALLVTLCGQVFVRHRLFESNFLLLAPAHTSHRRLSKGRDFITVAGHLARQQEWAEAIGIARMRHAELTQAIPPAYTAHLGRQLRSAIPHQEVA